MLDWECERPSVPKRTELLACFLDAALPLDLMWRCHSRPHASKRDYIKSEHGAVHGERRKEKPSLDGLLAAALQMPVDLPTNLGDLVGRQLSQPDE
jgi:hypothetical protein